MLATLLAAQPTSGRYILSVLQVYVATVVRVTKRLIDLDDALLDAAQRELGTSGVSETVRTALRQAAAASARARQVEWLSEGGLAELADAEARAAVWR